MSRYTYIYVKIKFFNQQVHRTVNARVFLLPNLTRGTQAINKSDVCMQWREPKQPTQPSTRNLEGWQSFAGESCSEGDEMCNTSEYIFHVIYGRWCHLGDQFCTDISTGKDVWDLALAINVWQICFHFHPTTFASAWNRHTWTGRLADDRFSSGWQGSRMGWSLTLSKWMPSLNLLKLT